MYYKIKNKESKVYQELFDLRTKELQMEEDNIKAIEEKTGLKWENMFGHQGQQNFNRVSRYSGFEFTEPEKVGLKTWKRHKDYNDVFLPNLRTKSGREMEEFLNNGLKGSRFDKVIKILKLQDLRRFTFPYVEIFGDLILIALGEGHEPKDKNVIEITKREFDEFRSESK